MKLQNFKKFLMQPNLMFNIVVEKNNFFLSYLDVQFLNY